MEEEPTAAFVLSLIGGVLILLPSIFFTLLFNLYGYYEEEYMMGWHMMRLGLFGLPMLMSFVGLASGIIIIVSSVLLYLRPKEATIWGTLIIAFSVIALAGMGGFFIGFLLGLIGGILALTWKPQHS